MSITQSCHSGNEEDDWLIWWMVLSNSISCGLFVNSSGVPRAVLVKNGLIENKFLLLFVLTWYLYFKVRVHSSILWLLVSNTKVKISVSVIWLAHFSMNCCVREKAHGKEKTGICSWEACKSMLWKCCIQAHSPQVVYRAMMYFSSQHVAERPGWCGVTHLVPWE